MLSDKEFFLKLKRYIEDAEHKIDGEWGHCRSVEQLISDGEMPDLYFQVLQRITSLAQPAPTGLPPGYIDPEHTGADRHLLQVFYRACQSEGGTADEINLRGIRAVLADAALAQPEPEGQGPTIVISEPYETIIPEELVNDDRKGWWGWVPPPKRVVEPPSLDSQ